MICSNLLYCFYLVIQETELARKNCNFLQRKNLIISDNLNSSQTRAANNESLFHLLKTERPETVYLKGTTLSPENDVLILCASANKKVYLYSYYINSPERFQNYSH